MRPARGTSAIFYLLAAISFLVLLLAVPLPSYSINTKSWFLDQSLGQRLMGEKPQGVPLYEVANDVTRASVTSPLNLECETDADCKEYVVANQCASFCGNLDDENAQAVAQLNNRRVCDPSEWSRPSLTCGCIAGRCIDLE